MKTLFTFLFSLFFLCSLFGQTRDCDPVVLEGTDASCMLGIAPTDIVAFKYENNTWEQIPVQVDERRLMEITIPYGGAATGACYYKSRENVPWDILFYTDPNTRTGADSTDLNFDADDEIAFMAKDVGANTAPATSCPGGVFSSSKCEVTVNDPLNGGSVLGYIYLFEQDGSLAQDAGEDYVDYDYDDFGGDYFSNYAICVFETPGSNPEDSEVTTGNYSMHFSRRWVKDELKITAGNASGIDILDHHQYFINVNACNRNEVTFSNGKGPIIANIDGPIRGIRSVMGANSGSFMQLDIVFTECRADNRMYYRLHPANGYYDAYDLNSNAIGMSFYNDQNTGGVLIDGQRDQGLDKTNPNEWELIVGAPGAIAVAYTFDTDIMLGTEAQYNADQVEGFVAAYQSDLGPAEPRECTGDEESYNASGFCLRTLQCTDDRYDWATSPSCLPENVKYFHQVRFHYFLPPQTTTSEAAQYSMFAKNPLTTSTLAQNCTTSLPTCMDGIQNGDEEGVDCGGSSCPPCSMTCPDEMISSVPSAPGTYTYENNNSITSTAMIEPNTNVTFEAENYISLQDGFHAKGNSTFTAKIATCGASAAVIEQRSIAKTSVIIHPNPVFNEASIQLHLEESSRVNLHIYDINGRKIRTITANEFFEKGNHLFRYDVSFLKNGLYLLEAQIENERIVQKLMVAH